MATLIQQRADLQAKVEAYETGIADLLDYVRSAKFQHDTNVNASDIILRLHETQRAALDA